MAFPNGRAIDRGRWQEAFIVAVWHKAERIRAADDGERHVRDVELEQLHSTLAADDIRWCVATRCRAAGRGTVLAALAQAVTTWQTGHFQGSGR